MVAMIWIDAVQSPVGLLTIAERAGRVCLLHFGPDGPAVDRMFERWYPGEARARQPIAGLTVLLERYFKGETPVLDSIPVELNGTSFQKNVWQALRRIPCGTTISYAELAKRIGDPAAVRAVGTANGANPVAVIVPCHRVIGSNGKLTGYGGGIARKQWLLEHEGAYGPGLFDCSNSP
jgi:methylated-DNA-[protein]-cysteine S-methyltransferase